MQIFQSWYLMEICSEQQQYTLGLPDAICSTSSKKQKKIYPEKNSLYFRKWNFLALILKKNQETETPKKIPYISGEGNPKKAFYILGNRTFQPKPQKIKKIHLEKKFLMFGEMEQSNSKIMKFLIFSEKYFLISSQIYTPHIWPLPPKTCSENFFYIFSKKLPFFWKQKPRKNPYVSGDGIFFPISFQDQKLFILFFL